MDMTDDHIHPSLALDLNNITTDGFYDMGPVRDGTKFLTIEELAAQDVNDRRPVLIVYAPETK